MFSVHISSALFVCLPACLSVCLCHFCDTVLVWNSALLCIFSMNRCMLSLHIYHICITLLAAVKFWNDCLKQWECFQRCRGVTWCKLSLIGGWTAKGLKPALFIHVNYAEAECFNNIFLQLTSLFLSSSECCLCWIQFSSVQCKTFEKKNLLEYSSLVSGFSVKPNVQYYMSQPLTISVKQNVQYDFFICVSH